MTKIPESDRKLAASMAASIAGQLMSSNYDGHDQKIIQRSVRVAMGILRAVNTNTEQPS